MIYSMTGFSSASREFDSGAITLELRSLNHRYLDIQFKMPDEVRYLEPLIREKIAALLSRGKVECRLSFGEISSLAAGVNEEVLGRLAELSFLVKSRFPQAHDLSVAEILKWPGVFETRGFSQDVLRENVLDLFDSAMRDFNQSRAREGEKLKDILLDRMRQMRESISVVAPRIPTLMAAFRERLAMRLKEAMVNVDDERIRQELVLFAGKIDVDEELSRLAAHLSEMDRILAGGGASGKRLDFLMQELNREANTLGSKSVDVDVSRVAMELKVLIEQMREQIQNIE